MLNKAENWHALSDEQYFSKQLVLNICRCAFKGAMKLYFTDYLCVVIILFNTGLYKSAFFTESFGKLVLCLSALFVFSACSVSNLMYLQKLYNIGIIMA